MNPQQAKSRIKEKWNAQKSQRAEKKEARKSQKTEKKEAQKSQRAEKKEAKKNRKIQKRNTGKNRIPGTRSRKLKKVLVVLLVLLILGGSAAGGMYAYQNYRQNNMQIEVVSVANLNWGYSGNDMTSAGIVTSDYTQSIYAEDKKITEVKVTEGAEVKVGDPLLTYDTSEIELQVEMKELQLQGINNDITLAKRELDRLNKIKVSQSTAAANNTTNTGTGSNTSGGTQTGGQTGTSKGSGIQTVSQTGTLKGSGISSVMTMLQSTNGKGAAASAANDSTVFIVEVPKKDGDAYNYIDAKSKPYKGTGTVEDPFRFLCTRECYVLGSYLNQLIKKEQVAAFEIWNGNTLDEGTLLSCWTYNGVEASAVEEDSKWLVATQQKMTGDTVTDSSSGGSSSNNSNNSDDDDEEDDGDDNDSSDDGNDDSADDTEEYTASELREAKAEKERELKDLDLDKRAAELELEKIKKSMEDATVTAKIDGVVKSLGDPENPPSDGSPFMEISGSNGIYVKGEISELMLGEIQVGQEITANSWSNGQMYSAKITEISEYPSENSGGYYGEGNPNVSYYSFMAYMENASGLNNGDYVDLSMTPVSSQQETDSIYLEKAYVRQENGNYYVLKVGEDDRLVKQYVQTGKTLYGSAIEIKSGITQEDQIAFPYGKNAKEGAHAIMSEEF